MSFLFGTKGRYRQKSLLGPEQQGTYNQLNQSIQGPGAGGAFGDASDYYRSLLNDDNSTNNALAAPEMRRFNEQTIPDLAEQFAGFGGSGSLNGSGFRNAAVNAGTDLSERLGAIRAQLRQQGAAGLMGLGQQGLGQFNENIYEQPTQGLLGSAAQGLGQAAGALGFGGAGNWLNNRRKQGGVV